MRTEREYLEGLAQLHLAGAPEVRRGLWRQSMAALAAEAAEQRPVPLEGLDPHSVLESVRAAIAHGLIEDLDFLDASHGAAALYELAAVLPMSEERRMLGRRVAQQLHQGAAATFVVLATQLAIGSRRGLSGPGVRARVALALDLPIGSGVRVDPLALALISRRELEREWLTIPSQGALPSRRLAARLLERAAREAARRASLGNQTALAVFERPSIKRSTLRLLADREPLVWRHVAAARGLLSAYVPAIADALREGLDPRLSPTEWRRAVAGLAASLALDPDGARLRLDALLDGPLVEEDPGLPGAAILGLPRAAEMEPEAAEELLEARGVGGGLGAVEAFLDLRREVGPSFAPEAARRARERLRESMGSDDDGRASLALALDRELGGSAPVGLRARLQQTLLAFAKEDARAAFDAAHGVLDLTRRSVEHLEACDHATREGRMEAARTLRELDWALLETSTLRDLLTLGARSDDSGATDPVDALVLRLIGWILAQEDAVSGAPIAHPTLRLRRLKTLLHAVDADCGTTHADAFRLLRLRCFGHLLRRVRDEAPSRLTRILTAATARAIDAMLREEVGELSDVLIVTATHIHRIDALRTIAEASMVPEVEELFRAYAALVERSQQDARTTGTRARATLDALHRVLEALPAATSPRVDALHAHLTAYSRAIEGVVAARTLHALTQEDEGKTPIGRLERAAGQLSRLVRGARRRLGDPPEVAGEVRPALRALDIAVERAFRGDHAELGEALVAAIDALRGELPAHMAEVAATALLRAVRRPAEASPEDRPRESVLPARAKAAPLPPWLPPSRVLGGFYVLRALGSGGVGTVFVACRAEERQREDAPRFALKVPEYGGSAARTLSQVEFLQLFREEAGALLAIPQHPNLARLVTFDAGARPKPILVMELVEGPTLERTVETGALSTPAAFRVLDGMAQGLQAMHRVGVGHLDLKPSNVILRPGQQDGQGVPVLVDFGLAGRKLRAGCATVNYGAPEIWGLCPKGHEPRPMAADVYAFACLAFETLTGRELIHGRTEVAIITSHLNHDGDHDSLKWLAHEPSLRPIAEVLRLGMRQDPRERVGIAELQEGLQEAAEGLLDRPWPLTP
jgi:hypothetical protein